MAATRRRSTVVAACAALALLAAPASAGSAPACRLLTDTAGDGKFGGSGEDTVAGGLLYNDPSLDIRSVDVASNPAAVSAALRLTGYERVDVAAPTGRMWVVVFKISKYDYPVYFQYLERPAALPEASWGVIAPDPFFQVKQPTRVGTARFALDATRAEIRIWVPTGTWYRTIPGGPWQALAGLGGPGRAVHWLEGGTFRWVGDPTGNAPHVGFGPISATATQRGSPQLSDVTAGTVRYVGGTRSCLPVGR